MILRQSAIHQCHTLSSWMAAGCRAVREPCFPSSTVCLARMHSLSSPGGLHWGQVRATAVAVLRKAEDEEVRGVLLQLVQALRYEPADDSRLAAFLVQRAARQPTIAIPLHWCVRGRHVTSKGEGHAELLGVAGDADGAAAHHRHSAAMVRRFGVKFPPKSRGCVCDATTHKASCVDTAAGSFRHAARDEAAQDRHPARLMRRGRCVAPKDEGHAQLWVWLGHSHAQSPVCELAAIWMQCASRQAVIATSLHSCDKCPTTIASVPPSGAVDQHAVACPSHWRTIWPLCVSL